MTALARPALALCVAGFGMAASVALGQGLGPGARETIADRVVGQAGFAAGGSGLGAAALDGPAAVTVGLDGRLYVADSQNSRVLSWASARGFTIGAAADLVLGQDDFTTSVAGAGPDRLDHPEGIAVDPSGNVFVADTGNHRIMVFSPPLTNGMNSSASWGSLDPAPNCGGVGLSVFCSPRGLASDAAGNLYLADQLHNRVLIYQAPLSTDTVPDRVLGGLAAPRGVAVDAAGNVYVADAESDMLREFDNPLASDTVVDRSFGSGSDGLDCLDPVVAAPTSTSLACPSDLAIDPDGSLYVSDMRHNRVLAYLDPLNDGTPEIVFGQHGLFTTGLPDSGGRSAEALHTPQGLAFDAVGSLYLADADNNRVLVFDGVKGDFNKDSRADLVFAYHYEQIPVAWFMDGAVQAGSDWLNVMGQVSWRDEIVLSDDFNKDNRTDLLLWNGAYPRAEVWLLNGTHLLGPPIPISGAPAVTGPWRMVATGDFNSDGWPDILWRHDLSLGLVIWTLEGTTATGAIIPSPSHAADANWTIVDALDFNKDGNRDLLWYNVSSGKVVIWFMDASVVRQSGDFTTPSNAGDVVTWELRASGDYGVGAGGVFATNDLVWRNTSTGKLVVWFMDTTRTRTSGAFTTPSSLTTLPNGQPTGGPEYWYLVGPR